MRIASMLPLLVVLAPLADAFSSLPKGSPHDDITAEAARAVDWPSGAIAALQEAVRAPDIEEFRAEPQLDDPTRIDATDAFDPAHHCDRVPPMDNLTAFRQTAVYVRSARDEAAAAMGNGSAEEAVERLGAALHAAQDCFSHSNYVDLDPAAREQFVRALQHGIDPPGGVVLTAFDPDSDDTTMPDDPYPHDRFAKDAPDFNNESSQGIEGGTKYEVAHRGAVQVSAAIMAEFLGPLNETQRASLAALEGSDGWAESLPLPLWPAAWLLWVAARRK